MGGRSMRGGESGLINEERNSHRDRGDEAFI